MSILTQMTINHDKKLTSFFNMPVKEVTGMRGKPDRVSESSQLVRLPNSLGEPDHLRKVFPSLKEVDNNSLHDLSICFKRCYIRPDFLIDGN